MGKSSKASKSEIKDRRKLVEEMRRDQERAEKKRTYAIIGACVGVGVVIIGLGAYPLIQDARTQDRLGADDLARIGASAQAAGCQEVVAEPATGSADHRPVDETIPYEAAPPASGPHYPSPAPITRKFYASQDRPDLGYLVHNLEHGYTVMWYDETVADAQEQVAQVEAIANKFSGESGSDKFIAAPWTADDGAPFPDRAHVALSHWSLGGTNRNPQGQQSIRQYCDAPSGEAVADFVEAYPYTDSPEPNAP